ncbi:MAG: Mov34/MPN/PAD-1 family protein [Candidatus Bathyarchaeia archaeon]
MAKILVVIHRSIVEGLLQLAREMHPKEIILLLRGKVKGQKLLVEEALIPPFAIPGIGFSSFPLQTLPMDFSIIGTAHSHPSGILHPSTRDLNRFYGKIMLIIAYPYDLEGCFAIFDGNGNLVNCEIIDRDGNQSCHSNNVFNK